LQWRSLTIIVRVNGLLVPDRWPAALSWWAVSVGVLFE
jgi:hypothetical protein